MKKQLTTLAVALTVMLTGISATYACEGCGCGCGCYPARPPHVQHMKMTPEEFQVRMEQRFERFDNKLGLTDTQKTQAKQIRENAHQKVKPLVDKKIAKIKEIREIKHNDNILIKDQDKKIAALREDIKKIDQDIRQVGQDTRKEFKALLTAEQMEKLAQLKAERKKHHRMHRHCCPPPRMF